MRLHNLFIPAVVALPLRSLRTSFVLASVALSATAYAAETGELRGTIADESGLPVPGATITLEGKNLAGTLSAKADDNGRFTLVSIPPGEHQLTVSHPKFSALVAEVVVVSGTATFAPLILRPEGSGEMTVEGVKPVVDTTRSSLSTELGVDLIQNLPVGRSYQDAVQLAPGVSGRTDTVRGGPGSGNPSVRGEGEYGNNYLMDGISTRDPATKTFAANIDFDAIEEIQVYTDGLPAEFGQATGMLVNVVTKDGGDEHHGSAAYFLEMHASGGTYDVLNLETGEEEPTKKRQFMSHEIALTAGGPIIAEKLWYFAAGSFNTGWNKFEGMEEGADPYTALGGTGFGKITWFINPSFTLQYQGGLERAARHNIETSGLYSSEAQGRRQSRQMSHILTARWLPTPTSSLQLKASYLRFALNVVPEVGTEEIPQIFDIDKGLYTNNYDTYDYNVRSRMGANLVFSQFVANAGGEHRIKVGAELFSLDDSRQLIFTGEGDGVQYTRSEANGFACTEANRWNDCLGKTEYEDVGALGHQGLVLGAFIQDDWRPIPQLAANIGIRFDRETLFQNAGDSVVNNVMPAPRLGAVWDVTGDSKTKVMVNAGRYYDLSGNTFAAWADTRSAFVYREYENSDPVNGNYELVWEQNPTTDPLIYCTDKSLDAIKDGPTPEYEEGARAACGESRLRPYYMDKLVLGAEREIIPLLSVGLRGILSRTSRLAEDIDYDLDVWVITNPDLKRRDYRALELQVKKKYDGLWQLLASYTLSESKGHTPGQFELPSGGQSGGNGNGVGVYMDDISSPEARQFYADIGLGWLLDGLGGLGTIDDDAGYYGYLPYHAWHNIKLAGSVTMPWGTTLGAVYEYSSGNAWQKRGYVALYRNYYAYPEGRGSRFMPAQHFFDFRLAHKLDINENMSAELTVDVFNIFDFKQVVTYYENDNASFGKVLYRQAPRSLRIGARFRY